MNYILKNCNIYKNGSFVLSEMAVCDGVVSSCEQLDNISDAKIIDCGGAFLFPGLADVHVHLREPGFLYKETIATGTAACARGGFTDVCSMPNLLPCPDSVENINIQLSAIEKNAKIRVHPYATITESEKGENLVDFKALSPLCVAFSDDGRGVQSQDLMKEAMQNAKACGKLIAAHCEDNSLLFGGYIHDGIYCREHGHKGICSESEWGPIERDIELVRQTGCGYHVCHISTKESVELIRNAKKEGLPVTCETGPHYLVLCDEDLQEDGRFKMNPPLRSREDRQALIDGLLDGTIDMIATDHAPHSKEEKSKGLEKSLMGVVGIETSFAVMYTHFVKSGKMILEDLIVKMCINPRKRFSLPVFENREGEIADFTIFNLNKEYTVNPDEFLSMGKSTPFAQSKVFGECLLTVCGGKVAYVSGEFKALSE